MLRELVCRAGGDPPPIPTSLDPDALRQDFLDYGDTFIWKQDAGPRPDNNALAFAALGLPDMPVILPPEQHGS